MSARPNARRRILDRIAQDRPAAVAGPAPFWSRLIALPEDETLAALDALVAEGLLRRVTLIDQTFYIADPPHAPGRG